MRHLATYMLEVAVCGGILQAVYSLLLERRIRFRWCRIYLLATTLLAAIIPLLRIPVWPGEVITVAAATTPVEGFAPAAVPTAAAPQTMPAEWLVYAVWALGTLFLLGLMAVQVLRIRRLKQGAEVVRTPRYTLVHTPQRIASFSFLNTIYVWQQTPAQEMEAILRHEASHIAHRHTIEHIVMESLKALLWWNPFAWIAARRLIEAEEFEADSDVLEGGYDRELYMNAIFRQLFGYSPEIANGLQDSLTKKRFKMMTSQKPGRYALLRLAGALPAIAGLLCAFSFTSRAAQTRTDTPSTDRAVYLINGTEITTEAGKRPAKRTGPDGKEDDTPFLIAERMPLFQGGDLIKFREWIQTRLRYPEEARKQGIQGRVVLTFVVERDGSVTETSVLQSPHQLLTTETLRIVRSSSGLWSPAEQKGEKVRLKYTLPVDFRMAGREPDASVEPEIERTPSTVEPIVAVSFGEQEQ